MKRIKPIEPESITYAGPSMNPTLKAGDRLHVLPYDERKIRLGDVIVFMPPEDGRKVTHRVISIYPDGIRTRGDSCPQLDPWVLSPDQILGRVAYAYRGKRKRRISGGPIGQLYALTFRAVHAFDVVVSSMIHPLYRRLARSGFLGRWLHGWIKTRVLSFDRPGGTELHLLLGRRLIGRRPPGEAHWQIRRPFRFFVDEATLPENSSK
jgi:hypothetical protein